MIHTIYIHQAEEFEGFHPQDQEEETLDKSRIHNIQFEDIDHKDFPDFADVFISYAEIGGVPLTSCELYELNLDTDFVHEKLMENLF